MSIRKLVHYPSPDEMIDVVATAQRNRSRLMRVLFRRGIRALKWRLSHAAAVPAGNRVSHA